MLPALLLADIDRFQAMRGGLKPGAPVDLTKQILLVLVVAAVIAVTVLAIRFFNRRKQSAAYHPRGLFRELSRAHGLDSKQDRLLREAAEALALEHPSRLFLEPNLFEDLLTADRFAGWQSDEQRQKLEALRAVLFGNELCLQA